MSSLLILRVLDIDPCLVVGDIFLALISNGQRGKDVALFYYELPADIMDGRNELIRWVDKSILKVAKVKK